MNKSVEALAPKKTNSTLVIHHRNKDFFLIEWAGKLQVAHLLKYLFSWLCRQIN